MITKIGFLIDVARERVHEFYNFERDRGEMFTKWWWTGAISSSGICFIFSLVLLKRLVRDFDYSDASFKKEQETYNEIIYNDMHLSFLLATAIKYDKDDKPFMPCCAKKSQNTSSRQLRG